jgi:hypothetical protein
LVDAVLPLPSLSLSDERSVVDDERRSVAELSNVELADDA